MRWLIFALLHFINLGVIMAPNSTVLQSLLQTKMSRITKRTIAGDVNQNKVMSFYEGKICELLIEKEKLLMDIRISIDHLDVCTIKNEILYLKVNQLRPICLMKECSINILQVPGYPGFPLPGKM